jgi:hypothetical protein
MCVRECVWWSTKGPAVFPFGLHPRLKLAIGSQLLKERPRLVFPLLMTYVFDGPPNGVGLIKEEGLLRVTVLLV